jgi:general secretion pathway protein G
MPQLQPRPAVPPPGGGRSGGASPDPRVNAAKMQVEMLKLAIDTYQFDAKQYPASLRDLIAAPVDTELAKRWRGPYMKSTRNAFLDPWGNPYLYAHPGKRNPNTFDVWSIGPDGQDGTGDDIGNWEQPAEHRTTDATAPH